MSAPTSLSTDVVAAYVRAGLDNIAREYPNHPAHVLTGSHDLVPPSQLHPIFFGSFDWHSSVHQHWMLVRLLRGYADGEHAAAIRSTLDVRFTAAGAHAEAAYLADPVHRAFERPYGWAWLLTLSAELQAWDDEDARRWSAALDPLTRTVRERTLAWLHATPYPQRSGTHGNSAFAAGLAHDAASATGDERLLTAIAETVQRWYGRDSAYPDWLEPSTTDFLSPALVEVDLMSRLLGDGLPDWLTRFLPEPGALAVPVEVPDRTDPHGVHLDGLNLSRAWCWRNLAHALPASDPRRAPATRAAEVHAAAALPSVLTGEYVGEHWLPTFAVYLLSGGAITPPAR